MRTTSFFHLLLFRLLHVTLSFCAVVLDVTFVQAVEAVLVHVLLCPLLSVLLLLLNLVSSPLPLPSKASLPLMSLPFTAPNCMDVTPPAAIPHPPLGPWRTCPTYSHARSSGAAASRPACAASPACTSPRPERRCLLSNSSKDAVSLVNSKARNCCIRPAALDFARGSTMFNAFPVLVIVSKKWIVELLFFSEPLFNPDFMTRVSDAAAFCMPFIKFLSNCPMWDNRTSSQSFHGPFAVAFNLPRFPSTFLSITPACSLVESRALVCYCLLSSFSSPSSCSSFFLFAVRLFHVSLLVPWPRNNLFWASEAAT